MEIKHAHNIYEDMAMVAACFGAGRGVVRDIQKKYSVVFINLAGCSSHSNVLHNIAPQNSPELAKATSPC